jgi:hypothetical protein
MSRIELSAEEVYNTNEDDATSRITSSDYDAVETTMTSGWLSIFTPSDELNTD